MLKFLILSKNKPSELNSVIKSIKKYCKINPENYKISILYTYNNEHRNDYNECIMNHLELDWQKETDFQKQLLDNINTSDFIFLLNDNSVFTKEFQFI